jgi:membrane protease YdiL (CAAX protease family)
MYDYDSKGISYTAGFFMLIAFTVAGLFLAVAISIPVWTNMTGKGFEEMEKALKDPAYANVAKILQVINAVVGFLVPAIVTALLLNRKPFKLLGFSRNIRLSQTGLVILVMIVSLAVVTSLSYFNTVIPVPDSWRILFDKWENEYNDMAKALIGLNNSGEFILALIIMGFLPALCEETLFRGGMQNFLTRSTKMPWLSIIIVSVIFSAVHLSFYGFLSRFFLGVVLGLLYQYSGNLWISILAHFINNAIAITVFYIKTLQGKPLNDAINENSNNYWGILALPLVIGLLLLFKRVSYGSSLLKKRSNN